ncbi:MAG: hypothetical protein JSS56_08770 [Proteobacteria bacterium]|nr:hypothetical protein [Pseudomonadota bacterium]
MANDAQVEAFQDLMKAWKSAFKKMRATELVCQEAVAQFKQGNGTGASLEQIAAAKQASELEAKLSKELNQLAERMKAD